MSRSAPFQLDFVGVGPQRAGTTWLHECLAGHPQVALPREPVKETFFFDRQWSRGPEWYRAHFDPDVEELAARGGRVGELGPSYFDDEAAPERLARHSPAARLIVNVRNPVEKTYSLFLHEVGKGRAPADFAAAVAADPRILTAGHYRRHILRWEALFGRERMHFVVLDDVRERPAELLAELCAWLEIDPLPADRMIRGAVNKGRIPRVMGYHRMRAWAYSQLRDRQLHGLMKAGRSLARVVPGWLAGESAAAPPAMTDGQRSELAARYEDDVVYLEELLGRSFAHWRTPSVRPAAREGVVA